MPFLTCALFHVPSFCTGLIKLLLLVAPTHTHKALNCVLLHASVLNCALPRVPSFCTGLIKMLLQLAPTLGDYYPSVKTVKQIKMDQDTQVSSLQAATKAQ